MNPLSVPPREITPSKEVGAPKETNKTAGTLNKEELTALVKEERPQKVVGKTADATAAFVPAESKNSVKGIKNAFISFFDKSVSGDKKVDVVKMKHEKQINAFFMKHDPKFHDEAGTMVDDPAYIKQTLDAMLGHIDDASKFTKKTDRQVCLDKLIAITKSPDFSDKLGTETIENILKFAAEYKNKVLK